MKTNTSIVQVQNSTSSIVPRPNKTHLIAVMVQEIIAMREAENLIRAEKKAKLQLQLDKEIEKFKKTSVCISDLDINWKNAGSFVYIPGKSIDGSPAMKAIHQKIRKLPALCTNTDFVKREVEEKMKNEIINSIMQQPGMKTVLQSTIAKLGL
jgi:hypothetical protein